MNEISLTKDYKFLAELTCITTNRKFNVPCKLYLPKKIRDQAQLVFLPNSHIFDFPVHHNCELNATLEHGISIIATDVAFGSGSQRIWDNGLDEGYILGHPKQIRIIQNRSQASNKEWVAFYLTESRLLSPHDRVTRSYDGTVQVEHIRKLQFQLSKDCHLSFENEYRYGSNNKKENISWTELIARADIDSLPKETSPEELLPLIDNFLLLVSLAEGRRCACMEMKWFRDNQLVHVFRLDRTLPEEILDHSSNNFLITDSKNQFEPFLNNSFDILQRSFPEKKLLWSALASITMFESSSIGEEFLRHFTALETLVLAFRRMNNFEYAIQNEAERKKLNKDLTKFLKGHELLSGKDKNTRDLIYENISGLFRISLKSATKTFAQNYDVILDDLWPLFEDKWSLLDIRNKIVHGEHFSSGDWFDILCAKKSLKIIVARFMLRMLGWDYQNSRAHWNDRIMEEWKPARERLSKRDRIGSYDD